jgi:hypothetical protein
MRKAREVGIVAQDPSVRVKGKILRSSVTIPYEDTDLGPHGARVRVIDYDASCARRYRPSPRGWVATPEIVGRASDDELLANPWFHAWNAYGIVMRTLGRFEHALGRRLEWSFLGHQLWVAPHAFADANAFYSEDDGALYFGYVPARGRASPIYTSLSHDIVAHETTHALLDGLRSRYTDPSSPEQAAFHEGFADVVALLSVLAARDVVAALLLDAAQTPAGWRREVISRATLDIDVLERSPLFGLAEQLGTATGGVGVRRAALRASLRLEPDPRLLQKMLGGRALAHDLGELFVAAMLRAYVAIWHDRLKRMADTQSGPLNHERVVEEASDLAERMLTVAIRAIDYLPVVDVHFGDFVRALVTADEQVYPDDSRYRIRHHVPEAFRQFGVHDHGRALGRWQTPKERRERALRRTGIHHAALQTDPTECFHFLWDNRRSFAIDEDAFVRVHSVRTAMRKGEDGAFVRETVIEYVEHLELEAGELSRHDVRKPDEMPDGRRVALFGGGALILDEFGDVKFHVKSHLFSDKQSGRLASLWDHGRFRESPHAPARSRAFARMHLHRSASFLPAARGEV